MSERFRARAHRKRTEFSSVYDVVRSDTKQNPLVRVYTGHGNQKLPPPKDVRVEFKDVRFLTKWIFPAICATFST